MWGAHVCPMQKTVNAYQALSAYTSMLSPASTSVRRLPISSAKAKLRDQRCAALDGRGYVKIDGFAAVAGELQAQAPLTARCNRAVPGYSGYIPGKARP